MGLNYTEGCVNFRDVGEFINLIAGKEILPVRRIYRGGSIDFVEDRAEIAQVKSILNLRNREDYDRFEVDKYHFPMANTIEKYDTSHKEVRKWLKRILSTFEEERFQYPFLVHCLSGKDRTGIVIAAILLTLEIPVDYIIEEYLLSDGEVSRALITQSIAGIGQVGTYFDSVNLEKVRMNILQG